MFVIRHKVSLVLVATLLLVLILQCDFALGKGGRGGGGRGGGSRGGFSRGGSSKGGSSKGGSKSRTFNGGSKVSVRKVSASSVSSISTKRRYSGGRSFPKVFIFYSSSDMDTNFRVNGNAYNTTFLLVSDDNSAINCLIVPKSIDENECPATFKATVTNQTYFYLPSEYSSTSYRYKSNIGLCCGSSSIYPSVLLMLISTILAYFRLI